MDNPESPLPIAFPLPKILPLPSFDPEPSPFYTSISSFGSLKGRKVLGTHSISVSSIATSRNVAVTIAVQRAHG
jgi:hypothetical protein